MLFSLSSELMGGWGGASVEVELLTHCLNLNELLSVGLTDANCYLPSSSLPAVNLINILGSAENSLK